MAVIGNSSTQQAFTPAIDYFSGTGSATAFTLSRPVASVAQVQVTIDNVAQNPSSAYTVSANTITFTSAPLSGTNNIYVYYTSPITDVIAPGQGTVTTTSLTSSLTLASPNITTALTLTGAAGTSGQVLTSAGSGFAPTWSSPSSTSISNGTSNVTVNSSGGTITAATAGTTAVTIDTSQNVGIGTGSPSSKLHVAGASGNGLTISGSGATGVFRPSSAGVELGSSSGDNTVFLSGSATERMRINSSGIVSVGTTLTDNPLGGFILYVASSNSQLMIGHESGTGTGTNYQKYNLAGATVGTISQVGTTGVAYNTTSDYRLKENVAPITGALNKVAQLKPCTYTWKSAPDEIGEGFIAHELQEVCPQAVTGHKDAVDENGDPKYQAIDTSFLVATLTAAIQELKAINDQQAETINALTARIVALEGV